MPEKAERGTGCCESCLHCSRALQYSAVSPGDRLHTFPGSPERGFVFLVFIVFFFLIFIFLKCFVLISIGWGDDGAQGALILFSYPKHCRAWGQGAAVSSGRGKGRQTEELLASTGCLPMEFV